MIKYITYLPSLIISILLGCIVYKKKSNNPINIIFSLLVFSLSFWIATLLIVDTTKNTNIATFFGKLTIVGPIYADLYVSTTGTDADWIVKIIDVYPDGEENPEHNPNNIEYGGYQRLIRYEIMRGKFRNSYENPEPFIPNKITNVKIKLNDIDHTFLKGHKIMIHIQSSFFPFFDRNPQKFVDIYAADEKDFQKAINRVYYSEDYPSSIKINVIN